MKYEANITYCISQMQNLYNPKCWYYHKEGREMYLDVYSYEEREIIEDINDHMKEAYRLYKDLIEMKETKDNSDF